MKKKAEEFDDLNRNVRCYECNMLANGIKTFLNICKGCNSKRVQQ